METKPERVATLVRDALRVAGTAQDPRASSAAGRQNYGIKVEAHARAKQQHAPLSAALLDMVRDRPTPPRRPGASPVRMREAALFQSPGPIGSAGQEKAEDIAAAMRVEPPPTLAGARERLSRGATAAGRALHPGTSAVIWSQPGDGAFVAREASSSMRANETSRQSPVRGDHGSRPHSPVADSRSRPGVRAENPLAGIEGVLRPVGHVQVTLAGLQQAFVHPYNLPHHRPAVPAVVAQGGAEGGTGSSIHARWTLPRGRNLAANTALIRTSERVNPLQFDAPMDPDSRSALRRRHRASESKQPPKGKKRLWATVSAAVGGSTARRAVGKPAVRLHAVPGRKGHQMGFGGDFRSSIRLNEARADAAAADVLGRQPQILPADVAEVQNDLIDALPLRLMFPASQAEAMVQLHASAHKRRPAPASTDGHGKLAGGEYAEQEESEPHGPSLTLEQRAAASMEQEHRLRQSTAAAAQSPSVRVLEQLAQTLPALRQARSDLEAARSSAAPRASARRQQLLPPVQSGGVVTTDPAVALLAKRRMPDDDPLLQDEAEDTPDTSEAAGRTKDSGLSAYAGLAGAGLVSRGAADLAQIIRSTAFNRAAGLAAHFCYWRVLVRMAVLLAARCRGVGSGSPIPGDLRAVLLDPAKDAAITSLTLRAWFVLDEATDDVVKRSRSAGSVKGAVLLALKAAVDALLRGQFRPWCSYERSLGAFHAKFEQQEQRTGRWQPVLVPLHAQIDALLSACFDASRQASFVPRLAASHEALHLRRKARMEPAGRAADLGQQRGSVPAPRRAGFAASPLGGQLSPGPSVQSVSSSISDVPAVEIRSAIPSLVATAGTAADAAVRGPEVLAAVAGLPYASRPYELRHLTSGAVHAALPGLSATAAARGVMAGGGILAEAPVAVGRAMLQGTHRDCASLLAATSRRLARKYEMESKHRAGHAERIRFAHELLLDAAGESIQGRRSDVYGRAVVEAGNADNTKASRFKEAAAAAGSAVLTDDISRPLRAAESLALAADVLRVDALKTADAVMADAHHASQAAMKLSVIDAFVATSARPHGESTGSHGGGNSSPPADTAPVWASPLRVIRPLIGQEWAQEHERSLRALHERTQAWAAIHAPHLVDQLPGAARPESEAGRQASEASSTPDCGRTPSRRGLAGPSGLPLTADAITALIAGRAPSFPSPFAPDDVSDFAQDEWAAGPGARAAAERAREDRELAVAAALRSVVQHRAAVGKRGADVIEKAAAAPSPADPPLVRLVRHQARSRRGTRRRAAEPAAQAPVSLVGVPDKWRLGLQGPGGGPVS